LAGQSVYAIIVTYNGEPWIGKCVSSLLASSVACKVIVIDNDSTDRTLEILQGFPAVQLLKTGKNLGFGKANNLGMEIALKQNADYFLLLNQDAWVTDTTIETLMSVAEKNESYGILSPVHLNGAGTAVDYKFSYYMIPKRCPGLLSDSVLSPGAMKDIYETTFANAACWLISRSALTKIGGFDPLFPHYGEDTDWVHRLHYHKIKIGIVPGATAFHDRPQDGWDLYKMKPKKRFAWRYIEHLIVMKNINYSFARGIGMSVIELAIGIGKSVHRLSIPSMFGEIGAFGNASLKIFLIGKNRKKSKQKACSFLDA